MAVPITVKQQLQTSHTSWLWR